MKDRTRTGPVERVMPVGEDTPLPQVDIERLKRWAFNPANDGLPLAMAVRGLIELYERKSITLTVLLDEKARFIEQAAELKTLRANLAAYQKRERGQGDGGSSGVSETA